MAARTNKLSLQIGLSFLFVLGFGLIGLIVFGHNAIDFADETALARQKRFASRNLSEVISAMPEQQRSATVWDEAVVNVRAVDEEWLDDNLGSWMQEYFGHHENYIIDQRGNAVFASVLGKVSSADAYSSRADLIEPLAAQLRDIMDRVRFGEGSTHEALAEVAIVTAVEYDDRVAIVSLVPIVSDSGELRQFPGSEPIHVAVRYVDEALAQGIGSRSELKDAFFNVSPPGGNMAGVPLVGRTGDILSWLVWKPERPGTDLFLKMLPVLLAVGLGIAVLLFWVVGRLLRVSLQLQKSEAQALLDLEELKQARDDAHVADRAKVNFMSVISHELRTPLTVILGYARLGKNFGRSVPARRMHALLDEEKIDPNLMQNAVDELLSSTVVGMEKIERSGEHLLFLVNQLLDYAKMETGRLAVDPEVCDVREVLEPVVGQMQVLAEQKGLELEAVVPSCLMFADITRTRQIIINLMGNAIKFTDSGKVSIVVTESEENIHIDVIDTGVGIEPHELERIFEAFHQADLSSTRSAAGTGLGLSVARELARLENGNIDVRSEKGVGSVFTLSLPREPSQAVQEAA